MCINIVSYSVRGNYGIKYYTLCGPIRLLDLNQLCTKYNYLVFQFPLECHLRIRGVCLVTYPLALHAWLGSQE